MPSSSPTFLLQSPGTEAEFSAYFDLRWRILRQPWQQPRGSEQDELESSSFHLTAVCDQQVVGVERLHSPSPKTGQVRYMAVSPQFSRRGIASQILMALETQASSQGLQELRLNARETALGFCRHHLLG